MKSLKYLVLGVLLNLVVSTFGFLPRISLGEVRAAEENALAFPLKRENIRIRDPFVITDKENGLYYMYAQAANRAGSGFQGVEVYQSRDLENWSEPKKVLDVSDFENILMVWAPEVHEYEGKYYMFVTLTFRDLVASPAPVEGKNWPPMFRRGTWVFRADSPFGPFVAVKDKSHTPENWMCLDGTLWCEDGKPFMVFCHEWVQIIDGTINVAEMKKDLSDFVPSETEPPVLLVASSVKGGEDRPKVGKVTDGPFFYRSPKSGKLFMIWSTFLREGGYSVIVLESKTGKLAGPWSESKPLFTGHGGHGMIFETLDGKLLLSLHQPNTDKWERFHYFEIVDDGEELKLVK